MESRSRALEHFSAFVPPGGKKVEDCPIRVDQCTFTSGCTFTSFHFLSARRNKCGKRVQAPRPGFHFVSARWHFGGTPTTFGAGRAEHLEVAQLGSTNVHLPLGVHLPLSTFFPPGGTNAEKGFRPLDRGSTLFPRGGTLAEPQLHSERGVQSTLSASRLRLVLPMDTWLLPLHSHGTSSMHTHANPYPPMRSTGCKKRVVTHLHYPDRPESPRSRHAPWLTRPLVGSRCALTTHGPPC